MTIKERIIEYRNLHKESRILLGVVLAEFVLIEKAPKREPGDITDVEAIPIIKKMIENNIICGTADENVILEKFVPKQLTTDALEVIIHFYKQATETPSIKGCMDFFKETYPCQYDGKTVSKIFNNK